VTESDDVVPFEDLPNTDLIVDQLYDGGRSGTMADDPLARLLPVGNQGGFRATMGSQPAVKYAAVT
jgi:hypothetical protein